MKKRKKKRSRTLFRRQKPSAELLRALEKAEKLLDETDYEETIVLLEPFLEAKPHPPELHIFLGISYAAVGDIIAAIEQLETAFSQQKNGEVAGVLGTLYDDMEYHILALDAYRQAARLGADLSKMPDTQQRMALFSEELRAMAEYLRKPVKKVAEGARLLEKAQFAFDQGDFAKSIRLSRQAQHYLGSFQAVENNLSLAYFFHEEPKKAIEIARRVLVKDPENIQALSNLVRFLAWTGRRDEAIQMWEQLRPLSPVDSITRIKKAEAAAVIEDDEAVYQLLRDLDSMDGVPPLILERSYFFRAVAEANTGRVKEARKDLESFGAENPAIRQYLDALKTGKPGTGLSDRFAYFTIFDLVPLPSLNAFFELLNMEEDVPPEEFRERVDEYLRRFPQLILVGKKMLWESGQPEMGIDFLSVLKTPEAYAVLRDFALGKKGDEQDRVQAINALIFAGELEPNEPIRFWRNGEWTTVAVKLQMLNPERERTHISPEVLESLEQGVKASHDGRLDEAEKWFSKALTMAPDLRDAYNNLAVVYARQGKIEQAAELFYKCIDLDPLYVFPRSNLASILLDKGKIDEAIEIIRPVEDLPELHPQEMASLAVSQARIQIKLGDFDAAENLLVLAKKIDPDADIVQAATEELYYARIQKEFGSLQERWRKRERNYRKRQRKLATPDPTVREALSIYTKNLLVAIARKVAPEGSWSKYRKAELLDFLTARLQDADVQARVLNSLPTDSQEAFREVQARGGVMAWEEFDRAFDNDLDDSPYWHFHEPQTIMGTLRSRGLLVETETAEGLLLSIPLELRRVGRR